MRLSAPAFILVEGPRLWILRVRAVRLSDSVRDTLGRKSNDVTVLTPARTASSIFHHYLTVLLQQSFSEAQVHA